MELRDIEYFAVVAEHCHLGRAAEALGLSTPAVSKSLRRLEKSVHAKLVKRTPQGLAITAEGSALLSHVHRLRMSLHDVVHEISDVSQGRIGQLRLGTHAGLIDDLVAPASTILLKNAHKVTLTVTIGNNPMLLPAIRNGQLDLIVGAIPRVASPDVAYDHLFDDNFVVYASSTHRLAKASRVTISELAKERWALPEPNILPWDWLHRTFENNGLDFPRVAMISVSPSLKFHTVSTTDLVGFTSMRALRQTAPELQLTILPVRDRSWVRRVGIGYRKDAYVSPAVHRFIEIVRTTAKQLPG